MSPAEVFSDLTRREEFFALAARIFGTDRASIDGATAYESIPGWDSVNHLRLACGGCSRFWMHEPKVSGERQA